MSGRRVLTLERLEGRSLLTTGAVLSGDDLMVYGTSGDDTITLSDDGGLVAVNINGVDEGSFQVNQFLRVMLNGGSDSVVASALNPPNGIQVYGTEFSDTVHIEASNDAYVIAWLGAGDDALSFVGNNSAMVVNPPIGFAPGSFRFPDVGDPSYILAIGEDGNDSYDLNASGYALALAFGGNGNDTISFAGSDDSIIGTLAGAGDDSIVVDSTGANGVFIDAGEGSDSHTVRLGNINGPVTISDSGIAGADTLYVRGTDNPDNIDKFDGIVNLAGVTNVLFSGIDHVTIDGAAGKDRILDPGYDTTILGGPGDDTIIINATSGSGVTVDGGAGSDSYVIGGGQVGDLAGPVAISDTGATGADSVTVLGTSGSDSIDQTSSGFSLNNTPITVAGLETATVDGGGGTDTVVATGTPPVPVQVIGVSDMVVIGTSGNDQILFNPGSKPGEVVAKLNGVIVSRFVPTGKLIAYGGAGNDDIQVAGSITVPAWLYGEGGNDRLNAGAGGSLLVGGDGNDDLTGGNGRDILIGGQGADKLLGNSSDDILIGGFTVRDDRSAAGHDAFWQSVLAEWNGSDNFATRVKNLKGANASYTGATLQPEVRNDAFADQIDFLNGSAGDDWLIFEIGEDKVSGQAEASN